MFVEHVIVNDVKKKLNEIYSSTESMSQYNEIQDNLKEIILRDLIREDEEKMRQKSIWKDNQMYDRSYSFPEVLEHDKYPEEVHAFAARTVPNTFDKDELTLTQAMRLKAEWPLWLEALRKELTSLIVENEVFEPIKYEDVPVEKQKKIFKLLIFSKAQTGYTQRNY